MKLIYLEMLKRFKDNMEEQIDSEIDSTTIQSTVFESKLAENQSKIDGIKNIIM